MSLWKLKLGMIGTLALIIGVTTLFLAIILEYMGMLTPLTLIIFVAALNFAQWLFAPYLIEFVYKVKPVDPGHWLQETVAKIAERSGIAPPKVMLAEIPVPNAFAYGSPLTGNRVAVTRGLLESLRREEIEAVLAHEIGHLVHRDVQVMMVVSILPAIFYIIGRSLILSGYYQRRDREGSSGFVILLGFASLVVSFILQLFVLGLSRLREYYADAHAATTIEDGATKLQLALAKIVKDTSRLAKAGVNLAAFSDFRTLFIADPTSSVREALEIRGDYRLVEELKSQKLSFESRLLEIFSTHPHIVKRLRALDEFRK